MPEGIFDKDANGNIIYDDARNKETSLMLAQEFFTNGTINQDEVDELARKIYVHRRAQSSYKKDDSNNSGNDDDKFSPIRKAGIVPIPKSEGVEGGIRGINYKATATQVLSDDGRKAIPTGFHVTKDGHVMITAVQPNEKIIAAATEGDGGVMEIMINNAEKMDPFRYDPNKHSGFLSTIQKAWDKPLTEAELAKLINEYNDSATGVSNELKKDDSKSKEKEEDKKTIIW